MNPVERSLALMGPLQYLPGRVRADIFGLLRGLSKEQVGTDGGTKDGNHGRKVIRVPAHRGNDKALCGLRPGHLHHEHAGHISEQNQRQPLQHRNVAGVLEENLKHDADRRKKQDIEKLRTAENQSRCVSHRAEVRPNIDGIGDQQQ